jgi:hypothetical protein
MVAACEAFFKTLKVELSTPHLADEGGGAHGLVRVHRVLPQPPPRHSPPS